MRKTPGTSHVCLRPVSVLPNTIMVAALALTLAACDQESAPAPNKAAPVEVVAYTVESSQVPVSSELTGRVVAAVTAEIRPQAGGIVRKRLFTEGSEVEAGQVLYEIDPTSAQISAEMLKQRFPARRWPSPLPGPRQRVIANWSLSRR